MSKKRPVGKQKSSAQKKVDWKALEIVHPDAAGIDVGGSEHWVAISPDRDSIPGAVLRVFYGGSARDGPVAGGEGRAQRGYAIDGGVLDARV
jgi:hypothetical protein